MSKDLSLSELLEKNMTEAAMLSNLIGCIGIAAFHVEERRQFDTIALALNGVAEIASNLYGELEQRMNEAQLLEKKAEGARYDEA